MTTTMARRRLAAGLVGVVALALAACSGSGAPGPTPSTVAVTAEPTIEPSKAAAPTPEVPVTWPLTGVPGDVVDRPAIAVKVENTSQSRPQTGLDQADVVWETIVEFDVSRFVAVFQSQVPEEIGPVRSVRPMDMPIAKPLGGLFAYSGAQAPILALARNSGLQNFSFDDGDEAFYRSKSRSAPHDVYLNPSSLWSRAEPGRVAPPPQFAFARTFERASAVALGTPAQTLTYRLSSAAKPVWTWDGGQGRWLRFEGSTPATVATGAQISAVNVVTVVADHPPSGFRAQNNASVPTYNLVGSGEGTLATGGKTVPVTWSKSAEEAPLVLALADGSPATLAPGNTWVELVPRGDGSLTIG